MPLAHVDNRPNLMPVLVTLHTDGSTFRRFLDKVGEDMKRYVHASERSYPYKATLTIYRLDKVDATDVILRKLSKANPLVAYELNDSARQFVISGQSSEVLGDFKDVVTSELAYKFIKHIWS